MFIYTLPDENNQPKQFDTDVNAVIIIGANGSGKSKLGAWIEDCNPEGVHRIGAQRNLNFQEFIPLKSYEQASNFVLWGSEKDHNKAVRWNWGKTTTTLLNDYENVLAALIALNNKQNDAFVQECKNKEKEGSSYPKVPITVIDDLIEIWNVVFPHRNIQISDSKVIASFQNNTPINEGTTITYHGNEMSDGERVVLYLILSFLTTPPNSLIIIDEPELHIHKAILEVLWDKLEALREDCVVMYITHDLGFALSRNAQKKIWMKKYDGMNKWEYEFIEEESQEILPKELLFQILGPSQKVIFLEGTKESLDYKLYKEIYGDKYQVIPCGGCSQVINYVKAARTIPLLNSYEIYGIIDRDFRTENEILSLEKDNIYVLKVAEVENLFIVPPLIEFMEKKTGCVAGKAQVAIKEIVQKYQEQKDNQVSEALEKEILHRVKEFGKIAKNDTDEGISNKISEKFTADIIKTLREEKEAIFNTQDDPEAILKVFNWKPLKGIINNTLGFGKNENSYSSRVLNYLSHDDESQKEIINILKNYCPLIPEEK